MAVLNLSMNNIDLENAKKLEKVFSDGLFSSVKELYLNNNDVQESEVKKLWDKHKDKITVF